MDPKTWSQIKWIHTQQEMSDAVMKQLHDRMIKLLRRITIQNIKMKL